MKKKLLILILGLVILGVLMRLIPHPANFSPLIAISLFAGYYLPRKWAILLPMGIMLMTDMFLGFYELPVMLTVYGCFLASVLIGKYLKSRGNALTILTSTLALSLLFFFTTNLAVWFFSPWYSHDLNGLLICFTAAIPFFKNSLMGNVFFVTVLFGSYELVKLSNNSLVARLKENKVKL
jgi:hypothetical protein